MKTIFLTTFMCGALLATRAQIEKPLTLDDCYLLARKNYPLIKQKEVILKSKGYSIENASKGFLPQLSISGQATYQSDVTEIPIKIPNTVIPSISKDQYKIYAQADQTIFDGGIIKNQIQSIEATAAVEDRKLEVELYTLKERVNQLFFGILLLKAQLLLTEIQKQDIQNGIAKINAAVKNGSALKSSADVLQADLLKADQHTLELKETQIAYVETLAQFIGQPLNEDASLEKPPTISVPGNIARPELSLFDTQKKLIDVQGKLITARNNPRVSLFIQGGYGRPALNFLKNEFTGYYIGGVSVNWPLSGMYSYKKDKALLENNRRSVDIQKETFLFNTGNALKQQNHEISKLEKLIRSDDELIMLRERIKNTAMAQLEYGVINSADYLREVNSEAEAKQSRLLHEIQLLKAQYDQKATSGN